MKWNAAEKMNPTSKRSKPFVPRHAGKGFTLIEVLLALGILSTVCMFAISAVSNQLETRNRLQVSTDAYHATHVAMARVFDDLRHMYVPTAREKVDTMAGSSPIKQILVWRPTGGLMYFLTQNNKSFQWNSPQSNIAQVRYKERQDPKDPNRKQLIRVIDTDLNSPIEQEGVGEEQVLVNDLAEFKVVFWNGTDFASPEWDTSNSEYSNKMPKMARIKIETYVPLLESEKQLRELSTGGNEKPRQKISLETIVFLLKTTGQPDLKDAGKEYRWQ